MNTAAFLKETRPIVEYHSLNLIQVKHQLL